MSTRSAKGKKRKPRAARDDPEQSKKFIEAAKALGVGEDGKHFEQAMQALVRRKSEKP